MAKKKMKISIKDALMSIALVVVIAVGTGPIGLGIWGETETPVQPTQPGVAPAGTSIMWYLANDPSHLDAPSINLFLQFYQYNPASAITTPESEGGYIYVYNKDPRNFTSFTMTPYSTYDRIEYGINDVKYLNSVAGVTYNGATGVEILDYLEFEQLLKNGAFPEGKLYFAYFDEGSTAGTGSTAQPTSFPLVACVDLNAIPNGNPLQVKEDIYLISITPTVNNTLWTYPTKATKGVLKVGAITTPTETNSTASNYFQFVCTQTADSGDYIWGDASLGGQGRLMGEVVCNASDAIDSITVNGQYVDKVLIGTTKYYFDIPETYCQGEQTLTIKINYTGSSANTIDFNIFQGGEWDNAKDYDSAYSKHRQIVDVTSTGHTT